MSDNLPRMDYRQHRRARRLVHECCNYDEGNCLLLDDGEPCVCVQSISLSLMCRWFRVAVLPLDGELSAALLYRGSRKRCAVCGAAFVPKSNRGKYCPDCAGRMKKIRAAADSLRSIRRDFLFSAQRRSVKHPDAVGLKDGDIDATAVAHGSLRRLAQSQLVLFEEEVRGGSVFHGGQTVDFARDAIALIALCHHEARLSFGLRHILRGGRDVGIILTGRKHCVVVRTGGEAKRQQTA